MTKRVTDTDLNEIRDVETVEMTEYPTDCEKASQKPDMVVTEHSCHIFTDGWGDYETVEPNDDDSIPFGSMFIDDGILFSAIACGPDGNKCFQFNRATGEMNIGEVDDDMIITLIMAPQDSFKEGVVRRIYHRQGEEE